MAELELDLPPQPEPGEYDVPIRVLHTPAEVLRVMTRARRDFLELVQRNGMTVLPDADRRWWPIAEVRARRKETA